MTRHCSFSTGPSSEDKRIHMTQSKLFGQMFSVWSGLPGGLSGAAAPDRGPGVSPGFPLLSLAAADGEQKRKKRFFGAPSHCLPDSVPRTPAKGWLPFAIPAGRRLKAHRTNVQKVCFVSCPSGRRRRPFSRIMCSKKIARKLKLGSI